jgi:AraC-like DNA-binding protein
MTGTRSAGHAVRAWAPAVPGVTEVLHARFTDHVYPPHTHDAWTLLVVDAGTVRYALDRREHGTRDGLVTLLPPHVPHDGRSATGAGFRTRVVYLDTGVLPAHLGGAAVDSPAWGDPVLAPAVDALHRALVRPGDELEAESHLVAVVARLTHHLGRTAPPAQVDTSTAARLRALLDDRVSEKVTLESASAALGVTPTHLVRAFSARYGVAPHRYLTGRRVDRARRLLLAGWAASEVAVEVGFHDQAHLTRHFRRLLGTTPGAFARDGRPRRGVGTFGA